MIAANIRYSIYKNKESIKLENKFTGIPLKIPLVTNMKNGYKRIQEATKTLKSSFSYIVASYSLFLWGALLLPKFIPRIVMSNQTQKFTMAMSNLPGPIKEFPVSSKNNDKKMYAVSSIPYIMPVGRIGICIAFLSWDKNF